MEFSKLYAQFKKIKQSKIISLKQGLLFFYAHSIYFMNTKNDQANQTNTRRKVIAGLGILSLLPILKLGIFTKKRDVISCAPEASNTKMKMLTQDGRLVEVDISKIKGAKEKISNKQLQDWVKKEL